MSIINNIFNIVYISSYIDSPRLKDLKEHLNELDINYKIIYGDKYTDINITNELNSNRITQSFYNSFKKNDNGFKRLIANYQTHALIFKEFLSTNYDKCLIIEDDCYFIDNYEKYINPNDIPSDYDYIQYGWESYVFCDSNVKDTHYNKYYDKLYWGRGGCHCYSITRKAGKNILKNIYPQYKAIDGFLGDLVFINKTNYPYDVKPPSKETKLSNSYISVMKIAYGLSQGKDKKYKSAYQEAIKDN